jgi:predicted RNase H-like HicB family nuclease
VGSERESVLRPTVCLRMGLEFKPLLPWEGEDHDRYPSKHYSEKRRRAEAVAQQQQQSSSDPNFYTLISDSVNSSSHREYRTGVLLNTLARVISREVVEALAVVNNQNLEYPVLVASEEDNVNEYKSFFSIVLDYPQVLGQGETKEYALRQATRLMHFAFGSMLLKGESIPPPTSGSVLEDKKAAMERDWAMVKLENFSLELAPLQFQPGIDYSAPPPDSDGEYDTDHEEEELFEPEGRMNSPEDRMHSPEDMFDVDESTRG